MCYIQTVPISLDFVKAVLRVSQQLRKLTLNQWSTCVVNTCNIVQFIINFIFRNVHVNEQVSFCQSVVVFHKLVHFLATIRARKLVRVDTGEILSIVLVRTTDTPATTHCLQYYNDSINPLDIISYGNKYSSYKYCVSISHYSCRAVLLQHRLMLQREYSCL